MYQLRNDYFKAKIELKSIFLVFLSGINLDLTLYIDCDTWLIQPNNPLKLI